MTVPLAGGFFQAEFRDAVGSTSDEARALAEAGAAEGRLVVADRQHRGRGRAGRDWISPQGNLHASFVLRPGCAPATAAQISFVAALALAETATTLCPAGVEIRLKWPNDVLANGRKIAGILLESAMAGDRVAWVVVGVGLNVASHPEKSRWPATSLAALGGRATAREALEAFAAAFAGGYRAWQAEGFAPVRSLWLARAAGLGGPIEVALGEERLAGRFEDIDGTGALVLAVPGTGRRLIAAGEVHFPRAA